MPSFYHIALAAYDAGRAASEIDHNNATSPLIGGRPGRLG